MTKNRITPEQMALYLTDMEKLPKNIRSAITRSAFVDEQTNLLTYRLKIGEQWLDEREARTKTDIDLLWG